MTRLEVFQHKPQALWLLLTATIWKQQTEEEILKKAGKQKAPLKTIITHITDEKCLWNQSHMLFPVWDSDQSSNLSVSATCRNYLKNCFYSTIKKLFS